uniref:RNase H type-1 domain-containing protein n=1 Tax=Oryza brachyantha TaxID=4533 RepID=J3NCG9_ORYBR
MASPLLLGALGNGGNIIPPWPNITQPRRNWTGGKVGIKLSEFDHHFAARHAIKSQALANSVEEWTPSTTPELPLEPGAVDLEDSMNRGPQTTHWTMHFDGSLILQGAGAGVILTSPTGDILRYVVRLVFWMTNKTAQYEGLLARLRAATSMGSTASWF